MNPASIAPPGRSTRNASRQTGRTSGTNMFEQGWTIRSNRASGKADRSAMSPWTTCKARPSRSATMRSWASWLGLLSKTVTLAPAAARVGPCCPPPLARQRTSVPSRGGNQSAGTGLVGVKTIDQSPRRARPMASGPTGTVHGLPRSTWRSHARRL